MGNNQSSCLKWPNPAEGSATSEISYTALEINMKSSEIKVKSSPEIRNLSVGNQLHPTVNA